MYQATVNGGSPQKIAFSGGVPVLNEEPFHWNLVRLSDRTFHILHKNRSFTAEVLSVDTAEKTISLKINQTIHQVAVKDRFDMLLEQMGMSSAAKSKLNDLKAPMPGLIVSVNVQPGDVVAKGDSVLILEAMKMENNIKSPGEGTIKSIRVAKGDRVEKNQVLIDFV
ncbi:acetyl-CoA carboxylase biotin carboxyl carrier protein subunit [Arsenicibacter rosenii]|uniref:Acetyl-CoA carboxylase biotin carboxyl carrier protein subunit n=1 Tax=Arsenicibacter rosenii TaxID=1750698 RepID=A0A1S2VCC3_9BACT|nr:acetyl-CoA carboxylase biotin carboxyl carrier protein subunit [Arsenicibacter rosenii]OIN55965.1 acetyl-CoA carboxylase biotin carboxyl carrier protein subunit [Arsenicibacter rosenii]